LSAAPNGEALRLIRPQGDWNDWTPGLRHAPAHLGEHTAQVLAPLGDAGASIALAIASCRRSGPQRRRPPV
jgi:crotonobetainyl-CoA:carnitine CoA-transferase CaiB-like acyl-CoA transferase